MSTSSAQDQREFSSMVAPPQGRPAKLSIRRANPLVHEAELKALMSGNGYAAFAEFFDRGYRAAVADGAASWIGFDDSGRVQMSMTQFMHRFQFGRTQLLASVTGNVMAAEAFRTFFPATALFRRMLSDTSEQGDVDLVFGDPTARARAVCQAVRMDHVGNLDRLVLPVADASFTRDIVARAFASVPLLLGGRSAPDVRCYPALNRDLREFESPLGPPDRVVPHHPLSMIQRRLPAFPGLRDFVVELRWTTGAPTWDALILLRLVDEGRILSIFSIRRRADISLRRVVPALAPLARRLGAYRLQVETLLDSRLAKEFRSLGFRPRGDTLPIFAKAFSPEGHDAIRSMDEWELTALDLER